MSAQLETIYSVEAQQGILGAFNAIITSREAAYSDAVRCLAKYKFWMFGYHAAGWVKYNRLLKGTPWHNGSPFKIFVHIAMIARGDLDNARPHEIAQGEALRDALVRGELI